MFKKKTTTVLKGLLRRHSSTTSATYRYYEHGAVVNVLKKETESIDTAAVTGKTCGLKFLASPINPADFNAIEGSYGLATPSFPIVGGNEGVAEITSVGEAVTTVAVGDWVIPSQAGFGTWRHHTTADEGDLFKLPKDKISVENAATLAMNPCTAYRLLSDDFVALQAGDVIIQNGANSSVGQAVIQIAASRGIKTINIMRQHNDYETTYDHLKGLGATLVVTSDYAQSAEFRRLISDLPAPKLGLNGIGGLDATAVAKHCGQDATFVTYGNMSKKPTSLPASLFIFKNLTVKGFWMSAWVKAHGKSEREAMLNDILKLALDGKFRTWIETFKFEDFEDALLAVKQRRTRRKVVVLME